MAISPTVADQNYRPAGTQNQFQKLDLYVPTATAPDDGYPVLVRVHNSSFTTSEKDGVIDGGVNQAFYDAGFAVADVLTTVYPLLTVYSPAGGGMFWRPSDTDWDIEGGGHDIPSLDAVWAIQWLKENAATYNLDTSEFFGMSASAGTSVLGTAACGADLSDAGSAISQCTQDTTIKACIFEITQCYWPAFVQQAGVVSGPTSMQTFYGMRKDGDTLNPCESLEDAVAPTGEDPHIDEFSWLWRAMQTANRAANSVRPFYFRSGQITPGQLALGSVDYTVDATTLLPNQTGTSSTGIILGHDPWSSIVARTALETLSPFHETHTRLTSYIDWTAGGVTPDALVTPTTEGDDMASWAVSQLGDLTGDVALNMRMDWRAGFETLCAGLSTASSDGMVQRRQTATAYSKNTSKRATKRWALEWKGATKVEKTQLVDAWTAAYGGAGIVSFTPPNESVVAARFVGDSLRIRQVGPYRFQMRVELEEMI